MTIPAIVNWSLVSSNLGTLLPFCHTKLERVFEQEGKSIRKFFRETFARVVCEENSDVFANELRIVLDVFIS